MQYILHAVRLYRWHYQLLCTFSQYVNGAERLQKITSTLLILHFLMFYAYLSSLSSSHHPVTCSCIQNEFRNKSTTHPVS